MEDKIKVLLLSPLPPPTGGIATWTKQYKENFEKELNIKIVNLAIIGKRKINNAQRNFFDEIVRTFKTGYSLVRELLFFNPNVVHLNSSCGSFGIIRDFFFGYLIKKKNYPLIVQYHCDVSDQINDKRLQMYFFRKLSSLADYNLVLNARSKKYVQEKTGNVSTLVPNFIGKEMISENKKTINESIEQIIYVGHIHENKGVLEIIEVAKRFLNIEFTLIGPMYMNVNEHIITDNVTFTGVLNLDEIKQYLVYADVFLFPSHSEGFSIALLEAQAMGIPIIATNVGANLDMLESKGGFIVQVSNVEAILEAIEAMDDRNTRLAMSEWNINKVNKCYSIDKVFSQMKEIYIEAMM